ncbi:hypothetical protein ACOSQ3_005773 [Xanthoceras sorbifolium]
MKSKVEMHDPNAMKTLSELNKIQEICRKSGLLNTSDKINIEFLDFLRAMDRLPQRDGDRNQFEIIFKIK